MADNIRVDESLDGSAPPVATDLVGGAHYQRIKPNWGPDGTVNEVDDTSGKRLPVNVAESALVGAVTETAPASDTASSGLNGRMQRIAQRLTSLIALLPTALTALGALKNGPAEGTGTATVTSGQNLSTEIDTAGARNMTIICPSTFDGTQIAFQVSDVTGGTYVPIYDATGQRVIITPGGASRAVDVWGEILCARFIKLDCLTTQVTTNTVFTLLYRS